MDAPGLSPACLSDLSSSAIWVSMLQSLARAFHLTPPSGERWEISLRYDKVRFVFHHPEIPIPISESSTRCSTASCGYGLGVNQCQ